MSFLVTLSMKGNIVLVPFLNVIDLLTSGADNVKLQEFLELMQPRSKAKSWGNDDMAVEDDLHSRKVETVTSSDEGSAGDLEELEGTSADEEINERNHDVSLELSDMDYLRSRVSTAFDDGGEEDEEVESQVGLHFFSTVLTAFLPKSMKYLIWNLQHYRRPINSTFMG